MTAFGPIESRPKSLFPPYDQHTIVGEAELRAALEDALRGVELGEYDRKVLEWLAGWETSTVATVVAWIERAKKAAVKDLESKLNDAYYERDCLRDELDALREGGAQ